VSEGSTPPTRLRLQKVLADAGVASRRAAERLITAGRVSVNGVTITTLGATADPDSDEVCLDGEALTRRSSHIYVALNKPLGYVTTASDERGRLTALDLVRDVPARLFPVGRLDRDSEGLLLLTTDGALTERLTHPRHEIEKEYMALVDQEPSPDALAALATGIALDGRPTAPAGVRRLDRTRAGVWLRLTLHEGRKRQVRRMCAAVGLQVRRLLRVRVGPVLLGELRAGAYRPLTAAELRALRQMAGLAATS
jgi:23S rRNA pseudouridine2605 synthase